jgi:hypothetical protein
MLQRDTFMNQAMKERWGWVEGTHALRTQLLDAVSDAELSFTPGGQAMTLGALCREMGDVEHSYVQSFKTFTQDFKNRNTTPGIESSVAQLKTWFATLDQEMQSTIAAMSDAAVDKPIDRGGFHLPAGIQLDVYLQALLIFLGKATIYLRIMNKPIPTQIQEWIW